MTPDRDIERVLEHWLIDGVDRMPDRVFRSALDRVERQPQAVAPRLHRRLPTMSTPFRVAALGAALLVIVIGGTVFLGGGGGPAPGTSASITPSPAPSDPGPSASTLGYAWPGALEAGTYRTSLIWDLPFEFEFTVPSGWQAYDIEISKPGPAGLSVEFVVVDNVFAEPCAGVLGDPPVGPSVEDLVAALATIPGLEVTAPTPVSIDRVTHGSAVDYDVAPDAGCAPADFQLWALSSDLLKPGEHFGGPVKSAVAGQGRIRVVDVNGRRIVIRTTWEPAATAADRAELQAIVDSIGIDRPGETPAPQPAEP